MEEARRRILRQGQQRSENPIIDGSLIRHRTAPTRATTQQEGSKRTFEDLYNAETKRDDATRVIKGTFPRDGHCRDAARQSPVAASAGVASRAAVGPERLRGRRRWREVDAHRLRDGHRFGRSDPPAESDLSDLRGGCAAGHDATDDATSLRQQDDDAR